jgi:hypothetical protein
LSGSGPFVADFPWAMNKSRGGEAESA